MADEDGINMCGYSENFSNNHCVLMLEQLNVQRFYGAFCDVSIHVGDIEFRLHRCVLAAASSKLQTMMYGLRDDHTNSLTMRDVSLSGFRSVLEFIYTGKLSLDSLSVQDVLATSQFLELRNVEKACLDFLKNMPPMDTKLPPYRSSLGMMNTLGSELDTGQHAPFPPSTMFMTNLGMAVQSESHPPPPPPPTAPQSHPSDPTDIQAPDTPATPSHSDTPGPGQISSGTIAPYSTQPPPPLPPSLPPLSLPPQPSQMQIGPPMSFPNSGPGMTMDTNYIEDYLKIIESMQGDQPPLPIHPSQSASGPPVSIQLPSSHDHTLHPPPPLYLQQTIGYVPPPGTTTTYTPLKEIHMTKPSSHSHNLGPVNLDTLVSTSNPQSHMSMAQPISSSSTSSRPAPFRYFGSMNPTSTNQYSAEDVRKTILNVLSQEKFDDDEDDLSQDPNKSKDPVSLTSLLNMAPIHRPPGDVDSKGPIIDTDRFEDISEIEDISNAGDDVDVDVDDTSSLPDMDASQATVQNASQATILSNAISACGPVYDNLTPEHLASVSEPATSVIGAGEEEITVDDLEPPPPLEPVPQTISSPHPSHHQQPHYLHPPEQVSPGEVSCDQVHTEHIQYELQNVTPPDTPVIAEITPPSKQKRKKKTPVKLSKDGPVIPSTSTQTAAVTTLVNATANNLTATNLVQSLIIITNTPTNIVATPTGNIHRDPSMYSKPLKKRIKVRMKKNLYCEKCGREFGKIDTLLKHQECHANCAMHCCHVCGQKYARLSELTRHMRTHSAALYCCWLCDSQFRNPIMFKQHMAAVHNEKKPFYCSYPECNFHSHKLSNVERHSTIHSERKSYMCFQCGKSFAQSNGLRSHLRSCMEQRGYLCDICGAKFNYLQSMKSHRLLHTGEKPHICEDCGSGFTDQRNYKRHRRIHENVFPYSCPVCEKKFRHSNSLKGHMTHHKDYTGPLPQTVKNTEASEAQSSTDSTAEKSQTPENKEPKSKKSKKVPTNKKRKEQSAKKGGKSKAKAKKGKGKQNEIEETECHDTVIVENGKISAVKSNNNNHIDK